MPQGAPANNTSHWWHQKFLEGITDSNAIRDVELRLSYRYNNRVIATDIAKMTVVHGNLMRIFQTVRNNDGDFYIDPATVSFNDFYTDFAGHPNVFVDLPGMSYNNANNHVRCSHTDETIGDALDFPHPHSQLLRIVRQLYVDVSAHYTGGTIQVTSVFRCPSKNNTICGASTTSKHVTGQAFDFNQGWRSAETTAAKSTASQNNWDVAETAADDVNNVGNIWLYGTPSANAEYRMRFQELREKHYDRDRYPTGWKGYCHGHIERE
jgi:hypothetical protein